MPIAWSSIQSRDGQDHLIGSRFQRKPKMFGRRYCLCHWPVWLPCSILAVLIIYQIVGSIGVGEEDKSQTNQGPESEAVRRISGVSPVNDVTPLRLNSPKVRSAPVLAAGGLMTESSANRNHLSSTRRSPARDHRRQSAILILVVQEEDPLRRSYWSEGPILNSPVISERGQGIDVGRNRNHKLATPAHIVQLMDVLTYHKIDFTLNVMPITGLPAGILQNPKRYSVIILDDFIKYNHLNRWARDQLDRFCRSNRIGVITYLIDNGKFDYRPTAREKRASFDGVRVTSPGVAVGSEPGREEATKITTEQYPLSFRVENLDCHNQTSNSCLVDYQLSDKTTVLRLLKSRPDFIIRGDLGKNLGVTSVVTLMSDHATHEPLTWAQVRRAKYGNASEGQMKFKTIQKRAVVPSESVSVHESSYEQYPDEGQTEQSSDLNDSDDDQSGRQQDPAEQVDDPSDRQVIAMLDNGLYDGIRRVVFGVSHHYWLNRLLLLDVIEYLSSGDILTPLERYIQIDIDDIFVGATGTRLNSSDVLALIEAQKQFGSLVRGGFKFNLGFSGKYFLRGSENEQVGDKLLVANADQFTWFCHFWSHSKAHLFNTTEALSAELIRNLKFAEENRLTLIGHQRPLSRSGPADSERQLPPTYAVAPHHSGVYPIHEQLYEAWRSLLNVQVTSTEEYPHLRPAAQRRGLVHKTIKVLPRQTCGLYTHTIFKNKYPGGFGKMLASIKGGELFETVLHNPVNIYMTHMSNYANDRLALFTFETLFEFVRANTNLQLVYSPATGGTANHGDGQANPGGGGGGGPMFLADYYFSLYPEELQPLWTNPCDDKRHLAIWSSDKLKLCASVPRLLIVGPQKTGTTALLSFLKLNPSIRTSTPSSEDFEEVQFFNDKHYSKGSDWYLARFQHGEQSLEHDRQTFLFIDKSATYFDDPKAPRRASSLLPDASIVILLINPADRAHSWYQHMRAHGDPIASEFSFDEVIMFQDGTAAESQIAPDLRAINRRDANSSSSSFASARQTLSARQVAGLRSLRNRCLHPGYYSNHLLAWLEHYPSHQILIVDGEWFKLNPVAALDRLQLLLRLPEQIDYEKLLVYNESKGFYCEKTSPRSSVKCLGSGKGRKYGPMSPQARAYLEGHYQSHNRQLARLLYGIGQPLPSWLDRAMNRLPPIRAQMDVVG